MNVKCCFDIERKRPNPAQWPKLPDLVVSAGPPEMCNISWGILGIFTCFLTKWAGASPAHGTPLAAGDVRFFFKSGANLARRAGRSSEATRQPNPAHLTPPWRGGSYVQLLFFFFSAQIGRKSTIRRISPPPGEGGDLCKIELSPRFVQYLFCSAHLTPPRGEGGEMCKIWKSGATIEFL